MIDTHGASLIGMYGHTANWDSVTSRVYVHGGLLSASTTSEVVSALLIYNPVTHVW